MKITIHEEKISHFSFYEKQKGLITSHENTLYHPLYGETPPWGPTLYPVIYHFWQKRYPFEIPPIDKWYTFHILVSLKEACKYKLRSNYDGLLLNPVKFKTLTMLGDWSFAAAVPQLWNSLHCVIRSISPSVASFKKTLKTLLFQKAFLCFLISFLVSFMQFFYDLSSLIGNFYSFMQFFAI